MLKLCTIFQLKTETKTELNFMRVIDEPHKSS